MDNLNAFFKDVNAESQIKASSGMLHALLVFFKDKISSFDKTQLNNQYELQSLFMDVIKINSKYTIFDADNPNNYWGLAQICYSIQKLHHVKNLDELTIEKWGSVLSDVIVDAAFSKEIGSKFRNNFRLLSKVLQANKPNEDYLVKRVSDPSRTKKSSTTGTGKNTTFLSILTNFPTYQPWVEACEAFINEKVMKTQNNNYILIELEQEGWKFKCDNFDINIDNGLYFGNKNSYKENQNIFISGINKEKEQIIKWEITKL